MGVICYSQNYQTEVWPRVISSLEKMGSIKTYCSAWIAMTLLFRRRGAIHLLSRNSRTQSLVVIDGQSDDRKCLIDELPTSIGSNLGRRLAQRQERSNSCESVRLILLLWRHFCVWFLELSQRRPRLVFYDSCGSFATENYRTLWLFPNIL